MYDTRPTTVSIPQRYRAVALSITFPLESTGTLVKKIPEPHPKPAESPAQD